MLHFKKANLNVCGSIFIVSGAYTAKILFEELSDLGLLLPFSILKFIFLGANAITKNELSSLQLCRFWW